MRRLVLLLTASVIAVAVLAAAAQASCVPTTAAQQRARANVIFDGIALEGPTATGVQRFRVSRYIKGSGPHVVRVSTGQTKRADSISTITSVSLDVSRGERWRIFARGSARNVLRSSACDGSRKL